MKKQFYSGGMYILTILILSVLFVLVGCRKNIRSTETGQVIHDAKHLERVKKWFKEAWQEPTGTSARVSPWLHDTSFIINNYANIILDWGSSG